MRQTDAGNPAARFAHGSSPRAPTGTERLRLRLAPTTRPRNRAKPKPCLIWKKVWCWTLP